MTARMNGQAPDGGRRVRAPRVAEVLANELREQILSGDLSDGDRLPAQDELLDTYGVGRPALREALRVLENEGLISVQRGNVGGSVVHRPSAETAAYTMGMVLQAGGVPLADVADALKLLEPLCAELCARRPDRHEVVLPELKAAHEAGLAAIDDHLEVIRQSRRFHEALAERCGNQTLTLVVGTLETLWSVHEKAWAAGAGPSGEFPDRPLRDKGHKDHADLIRLIESGDATGAANEARRHLTESQRYAMSLGQDPAVRVTFTT